jgi:hypothetical protein
VEIHLHRPQASRSRVPSAITGGNKIEANKTIYRNFARRIRTKKTPTFKPSELNGNQIAADTVHRNLRVLYGNDFVKADSRELVKDC